MILTNNYDEAFLQKYWAAVGHELYSQKNSIIVVWQGPKHLRLVRGFPSKDIVKFHRDAFY